MVYRLVRTGPGLLASDKIVPDPRIPAEPTPEGELPSTDPAADSATAGPGSPRWLQPVLVFAAVLAGVAIVLGGMRALNPAPIEAGVVSYEVLSDAAVRIDLQVRRDTAGAAAECIVRSRGQAGNEVGRGVVEIPPEVTRVSVTLATTERAVTGEVEACRYSSR
ncbi:hypothetical protein BH20ACT5_BH20ACT5_01690 [soil metagenome]